MTEQQGSLYYVVGAAGTGKEALLREARRLIQGAHGVVFAHRYITRPADPEGEPHVPLGRDEFEARRALGAFALHWQRHGIRYGVGREIDLWLAAGARVVVNGSRANLPEALARYPGLRPVLVRTAPPRLRERGPGPGRTTEPGGFGRLEGSREWEHLSASGMWIVENGGTPGAAAARLVNLLTRVPPRPADPAEAQQMEMAGILTEVHVWQSK